MIWGQSLTELFEKTGFTRWPLLLCSVIGLAIIMERVYSFTRLRCDEEGCRRELFRLLRNPPQGVAEAIRFCQSRPNPIMQIAAVYLSNRGNSRRESILSREGSLAMERVENRIRGLATITHVAPLLGLLGTVTGLVAAFHEIEVSSGQIHAQNLAGGIWEALLSTVFGLIVAIPCMVAYHGFESYADRIARRMQFVVSELDEFFGHCTAHDFKATEPKGGNESVDAA
jgi:biopolymer transport protein ExbB